MSMEWIKEENRRREQEDIGTAHLYDIVHEQTEEIAQLRAENAALKAELCKYQHIASPDERKVTKLLTEIERLKAELAEAKKDADIFQWLQDNHVRAQAFFWNYQSRKQRRKAILEAMKGK